MNKDQLYFLKCLPFSPLIHINGEWIFIRNAKVATTSMVELIKHVRVQKDRQNGKWLRIWDNCIDTNTFCFTFVRNPWSRCVSCFNFMQNHAAKRIDSIDKHIDFEYYVTNILAMSKGWHNIHWHPQHTSFTYNNEINEDIFVGRFETLEEDWKYVAKIIGVNPELPHMNVSTIKKDYRTYYNQTTHDIIADIYSKEIELLGYKFDP